MTSSRSRVVLIAAWLAAAGASHAADLQLFESVEAHMGTLARIKVYAPGPEQARAGFRAAFDRIAQLDEILSDYKAESELNRMCRSAVHRPVAVSADLFRVLAASQQLAEETDGAFDVTLGPVIRLWRQARREKRAPPEAALRAAEARSGWGKLHLDEAARTVTLDQEGMQLDLGAIGKGYAADAALAVLQARGLRSALVAVSGDLAFGDPPPGQRGWRIGAGDRLLELCYAAVSTSGDAEQGVEWGGQRHSHIIDPATGLALTRAVGVTVVARRGIDADALATAASVLGPERGMELIERHDDVAALMAVGTELRASSRWAGLGCGR